MKNKWILCFMVTVAACGGSSGGSADDDDSADNNELQATLSSLQENIFTPTCALGGCHSSTSASAGLSLAAGESFLQLVGIESTQADGQNRVMAGNSDQSYLINKLRGTQATVGGSGSQMPRGGSALSDEEIQAIEQWIGDGAVNN